MLDVQQKANRCCWWLAYLLRQFKIGKISDFRAQVVHQSRLPTLMIQTRNLIMVSSQNLLLQEVQVVVVKMPEVEAAIVVMMMIYKVFYYFH